MQHKPYMNNQETLGTKVWGSIEELDTLRRAMASASAFGFLSIQGTQSASRGTEHLQTLETAADGLANEVDRLMIETRDPEALHTVAIAGLSAAQLAEAARSAAHTQTLLSVHLLPQCVDRSYFSALHQDLIAAPAEF